jgi:hypothetical protein
VTVIRFCGMASAAFIAFACRWEEETDTGKLSASASHQADGSYFLSFKTYKGASHEMHAHARALGAYLLPESACRGPEELGVVVDVCRAVALGEEALVLQQGLGRVRRNDLDALQGPGLVPREQRPEDGLAVRLLRLAVDEERQRVACTDTDTGQQGGTLVTRADDNGPSHHDVAPRVSTSQSTKALTCRDNAQGPGAWPTYPTHC